MICISEDTFQTAKPIYRAIVEMYISRGEWKLVKPEEKEEQGIRPESWRTRPETNTRVWSIMNCSCKGINASLLCQECRDDLNNHEGPGILRGANNRLILDPDNGKQDWVIATARDIQELLRDSTRDFSRKEEGNILQRTISSQPPNEEQIRGIV